MAKFCALLLWLCACLKALPVQLCASNAWGVTPYQNVSERRFALVAVYRFASINSTCVLSKRQVKNGAFSTPFKLSCFLDSSFYRFIRMGTMFLSVNVSGSFTFSHSVFPKWYTRVYHPLTLPGYFGIKGNFVNFYIFKAFLLLFFCSMKVLSLSKSILVSIKCL